MALFQPDQSDLLRALRATWPPKRVWKDGGLLNAEGAGGGKRVSATRLLGSLQDCQSALLKSSLVQVPEDNTALDAVLADSHALLDPTAFYAVNASQIAMRDAEIYVSDAPLQAMKSVWAADGVDAARLDVMDRAEGPKAYLLARSGSRIVGVGFVAATNPIAMLHAVFVPQDARRAGNAKRIARAAAEWATQEGAKTLALAVVRKNEPAVALYESLGMLPVSGYHYRALKEDWA